MFTYLFIYLFIQFSYLLFFLVNAYYYYYYYYYIFLFYLPIHLTKKNDFGRRLTMEAREDEMRRGVAWESVGCMGKD